MAKSNPIVSALTKLQRDVVRVVRDGMEQVPFVLATFYSDRLQAPTSIPAKGKGNAGTGLRRAKSGRLYYTRRNDGDKPRTLYGNLTRALQPRGDGNASEVFVEGGILRVASGVDLDATVRTAVGSTSLLYARFINARFGTIDGGFRDFMEQPDGFAAIIDDIEERLQEIARG